MTAQGTGSATITATCGKETASVPITVAKGLAAANISARDVTYTGSAARPGVVVTLDGITLREGADYTVSYNDRVDVGTGTVTITGTGTYAGTSTTANYKVTAAPIVNALVQDGRYEYSPAGNYPYPTVTFNGRMLVEGTDYEMPSKGSNFVGGHTVTILGKGNFTGSRDISWRISKRDIADASISGVYGCYYMGDPIEVNPTVTVDGVELTKDTDYALSWKDNVHAGTATVTVTGKGNYEGQREGLAMAPRPQA